MRRAEQPRVSVLHTPRKDAGIWAGVKWMMGDEALPVRCAAVHVEMEAPVDTACGYRMLSVVCVEGNAVDRSDES